jgi:hypothetical protein
MLIRFALHDHIGRPTQSPGPLTEDVVVEFVAAHGHRSGRAVLAGRRKPSQNGVSAGETGQNRRAQPATGKGAAATPAHAYRSVRCVKAFPDKHKHTAYSSRCHGSSQIAISLSLRVSDQYQISF